MAEKSEEIIIENPPAMEMIATNTFYGFVFGSTFGLVRGIWAQKPSMNPKIKALPVPYAQIAQNTGSLGMNFAFMSAIYTGGACLASGIRNVDDSLNFGVGGAAVGMFLGLKSKSLHQVVYKGIVLGALGVASAYGAKTIMNNDIHGGRKRYYDMYAYMPKNEGK